MYNRYGIAAVVGEETSNPTDWTEISIPPRSGDRSSPKVEILVKDTLNDILRLMVNTRGDNSNCPVSLPVLNLKHIYKFCVGSPCGGICGKSDIPKGCLKKL